jgi:hypothetical protein
MELSEAIEHAVNEDLVLIKTLIQRVVQYDLEATSELKLVVRMAALIKNDDRAQCKHAA